jgi:ribosomal protein S18 acetylase RimI-like enzyme
MVHRMVTENAVPGLHVVDLSAVKPAELEGLWQREQRWWRDCLLWDISDSLEGLRCVLERGGVPGKAVRVGERTIGYAYYVLAAHRGVISGLAVAPEWSRPVVGETLLSALVGAMRQRGVRRLESQCLAIDCPWLVPAFERQGFQTYWRECWRLALPPTPEPTAPLALVHPEPWRPTHVHEAAALMQAAYAGGVDVEINGLYSTVEGCHLVLDTIFNQGGCGRPVSAASVVARYRGQAIGFVVVTETAPRQGHLAHIAVLPAYQGRGLGRWLLHYSVAQLAARQFDTLTLLVSRANQRARRMYQAMGWHAVLAFPVFVWEQSTSDY